MDWIDWILFRQIVLLLILLNFIPCYIAWYRHHHQRKIIFWLNLFFGWSGLGFLGLVFYAALSKVEMTDSSQIEKKEGEGYVWIIPTISILVIVLEIIFNYYTTWIYFILLNEIHPYVLSGLYNAIKTFIYVLVVAILFKIAFKKEGKKYIWLIASIVCSTTAVLIINELFLFYNYAQYIIFKLSDFIVFILLAILFWRAHKETERSIILTIILISLCSLIFLSRLLFIPL